MEHRTGADGVVFQGTTGPHAWTGSRMINVGNPDPADIVLRDIAVGLSRETRYGGSTTSEPWSVGQHLLLCDYIADAWGYCDPADRLALLLHDAPEYMLRDVIAPVKVVLPDYQKLEDVWWRATCQKFRIGAFKPRMIKEIDLQAAADEKETLISPLAGNWPGLPPGKPIENSFFHLTALDVARVYEDKVRVYAGRLHGRAFAAQL